MKPILTAILLALSFSCWGQEVIPLQPIQRTSYYEEPLDEPTAAPITLTMRSNAAARPAATDNNNTAGVTEGNLEVSGTGAAIYTVPIAVPQGIGGVAPTLALSYNSQSGNGIAGYSWHLSGLSVISRVGSTPYHNGKITEVNLTETDQFALDGQRLLLAEGTHGSDGARYETETFSHLRIKAIGKRSDGVFGPAYFEVLYPDGSKAYYGKEDNSRTALEYALSYWENAQGVGIKYLYKQEDNRIWIKSIEYGNKKADLHKINFGYDDRKRIEEAYVGGIRILNKKILSWVEVINNHQFERNYLLSYDANDLGYNRLKSVKETVGSEEKGAIEFGYDKTELGLKAVSSGAKALSSDMNIHNSAIVPLDTNGDTQTDFLLYPTKGKNTRKELYLYEDFISKGSNNIGYVIPFSADIYFQDVFPSKIISEQGKLDNRQAFVTVQQFGDSVTFKTYARNSISALYVQDTKQWKLPEHFEEGKARCEYIGMCWMMDNFVDPNEPIMEVPRCGNIKFVSGDFDGNGITDVVAIERPVWKERCTMILPEKKNGHYKYYEPIQCVDCESYRDSRGEIYWIDLDKRKRENYVKRTRNSVSLDGNNIVLAMDINGNGKTNLVSIRKGGIFIYEMDEYYRMRDIYHYFNNDIQTGALQPLPGDYNGDGKIDFLQPTANNSNRFILFTNTGKSFKPTQIFTTFTFEENSSSTENRRRSYYQVDHHYRLIPIDLNNDGKTDIIKSYFKDSARQDFEKNIHIVSTFINIGSPNGEGVTFVKGEKPNEPPKELKAIRPPHIIFSAPDEYNRSTDVSFYSGNFIETVHYQQNNKEDMLLKRVVTSGKHYNINYQKMITETNAAQQYNEEGVITYKGNAQSELYPYESVTNIPSLRLVSKIERSGIGIKTSKRIFNYYNAIIHTQGLGFLGFSKVGSSDWFEYDGLGNQLLFTTKQMNPKMRGALTDNFSTIKIEELSDGIPTDYYQRTSYQYTPILTANKVFRLQLDQQITDDRLSGVTTTQHYNYDAEGNITLQRTQADNYEQTTRISYAPKTESPYLVGLPLQKEVTTTLAGDTFSSAEKFGYTGALLTTHQTRGNGTGWRTERYQHDAYGNVIQQTTIAEDGQQRTEHTAYDPTHRFVTQHTDYEGQLTIFAYNNRGLLAAETSALGQTTQYEYDRWGRITRTTDFLGKSSTQQHLFYNGNHQIITLNDEGAYSAETYNPLGWLVRKESNDVLGNRYAVTQQYNGIGQLTAVSAPHPAAGSAQRWKTTQYNRYGQPTAITTPEGKTTRITYDKLKTTANDGLQQITTTRDVQGNIVEHTDNGGSIRYTYFANGNLKTADYAGAVQRITQDGWGRKTSLTDPSAGLYTYAYDSWGNITKETTPKGTTTFIYLQGTDRLNEKHIIGEYTNMHLSYTYNADKLLTRIDNQNADGNSDYYSYEYNALKQLVQTTESNPQSTFIKSYSYDAFGRVQQETHTAQALGRRVSSTVLYRYQNGGVIEMKTDNGTLLWKLTESNAYGAPVTLYKGKTKETFEYDTHFPKTHTVLRENTPLNVLRYEFDPVRGLLQNRTYSFLAQRENFAYDTTDRLTHWGTDTHQYDERGRITQNSAMGSYQYANHSYQQQKLLTNAAGEARLAQHPFAVVRYNAFKAPEQIYVKDKERISFDYNAFGGRAHRYYGGTQPDKAQRPFVKHYSHDGTMEVISRGITTYYTQFTLFLGGDAYSAPAVLISDGQTAKVYYLHRDYLGSIIMLTDENGNIAERRHFDAWGQLVKVQDGAGRTLDKLTLLDRGYTSHEHLQTVGLIHMNARLYDPVLHRFLQPDNYVQDPFNTQNFNRYGYCLNNPLLYTDESGEFFGAVIIGAIIGAYIGGTVGNNGEFNPTKWDYSESWFEIVAGAFVGTFSGLAGGLISTLQIPMANTLGIVGGSLVNSVGTMGYSEGKTDLSISFGIASYNFTKGSFGYLFKKGNTTLENIGYGLGALANLADLGETGKLLLNTEKKDIINHSAILDENKNVIISEGPGKNWIEPKGSVDHYLNRTLGGSGATNRYPVHGENIIINKVNLTAIKTYGKILDFLTKNGDGILPYSFVYSSCSTHTGMALNLAGIPTLFIHPYTVQGSVWLWNKGITPSIINNSYHLQNQRK